MEVEFVGYSLAVFVGISLGLIGGGGSILTVPILVYIMAVEPVLATAYSLFVVGTTSFVGGIQNALYKKVDFKAVLIFGVISSVAVFITRRYLVSLIPDILFSITSIELTKSVAMMILFAIVMIFASLSMIRHYKESKVDYSETIRYNYSKITFQGITIGLLTGLVGAGGGFLIIPSLVLYAKMPMKKAVGTSLFIIAINSLFGFIGVLKSGQPIDWFLLSMFSGLSIAGVFIGIFFSKKISGQKLKTAFGWFVLFMGTYIFVRELFF